MIDSSNAVVENLYRIPEVGGFVNTETVFTLLIVFQAFDSLNPSSDMVLETLSEFSIVISKAGVSDVDALVALMESKTNSSVSVSTSVDSITIAITETA